MEKLKTEPLDETKTQKIAEDRICEKVKTECIRLSGSLEQLFGHVTEVCDTLVFISLIVTVVCLMGFVICHLVDLQNCVKVFCQNKSKMHWYNSVESKFGVNWREQSLNVEWTRLEKALEWSRNHQKTPLASKIASDSKTFRKFVNEKKQKMCYVPLLLFFVDTIYRESWNLGLFNDDNNATDNIKLKIEFINTLLTWARAQQTKKVAPGVWLRNAEFANIFAKQCLDHKLVKQISAVLAGDVKVAQSFIQTYFESPNGMENLIKVYGPNDKDLQVIFNVYIEISSVFVNVENSNYSSSNLSSSAHHDYQV